MMREDRIKYPVEDCIKRLLGVFQDYCQDQTPKTRVPVSHKHIPPQVRQSPVRVGRLAPFFDGRVLDLVRGVEDSMNHSGKITTHDEFHVPNSALQ